MVLVLREAFALASEHARISGRDVVLTDDVVRALKVLSHPSCAFIDSLAEPTRAEHAAGSQSGLERAVEAIETCALALSVEHVIVDAQGRLRRASKQHTSEHAGEHAGKHASEHAGEPAGKHAGEHAGEHASKKAGEQHASKNAGEHASEHASKKSSEHAGNKASKNAGEQHANKNSSKNASKQHASEQDGCHCVHCVQGDELPCVQTNLFGASASALGRAANLGLMGRAHELFDDFSANADSIMDAATPVRRAIFNGVTAVVAHLQQQQQQQSEDDDMETDNQATNDVKSP